MTHWLMHVLGLDDLSGPFYGFWSGIAGDLGLFAGMALLVRKHNCHVKPCPRLGRYPVEGTPYTVCGKHHPDVPERVTHVRVLGASRRHQDLRRS